MNIAVCLPIALYKSFDYAVPPALEAQVKEGLRVRVPFGKAMQIGFITQLNTIPKLPKNIKLKEISEIIDDRIYYGPELMPLANFIADTYANTLGETLEVLVPGFINKKLLDKYTLPPPQDLPLFYPAGPLTNSQKNALETVHKHDINLFYGPVFTGKSEAALYAAHNALGAGGQVLILVPDIISCAALIEYAEKKFGAASIHQWHSKVPLSKRKTAAADILSGRPCVVIGTRSACLLPFKNLALSVMFYEEDKAYKQEDAKPYYHSHAVLMERTRLAGGKFILVSASPSMETLLAAQENKINTVNFIDKIPGFDGNAQVYLAPKGGEHTKYISPPLKEMIYKNMLSGNQALLIINRLGYGGAYSCVNCRALAKCKKCGALLIRAQDKEGKDILSCKKCSAKEDINYVCPACKNEIFRTLGGGTQEAQEELQNLLPTARIIRLDSQTLSTKDAQGHFAADALKNNEADIVIGTIMALKVGLLGSKINLIALLDADGELNSRDFRAGEHYAQLLFNLKGRLSRFKDGKFIIQTAKAQAFDYAPLKANDYMQFAEMELAARKEFNFPPYAKIVKLLISSKSKKDLAAYTQIILDALKTAYGSYMQTEGPVNCGLSADKSCQQYLLVKALDEGMLKSFIKTLAENKPPKKVILKVLADPYSFI